MKIYYIKDNKCVDLTPSLKDVIADERLIKLGITGIAIYELANGNIVYAAEYTGISTAVQPLINVLVDLAEPVSYGFMVKGFFQWMSGAENEGKKAIKSSLVGFMGIQFIPQIFKLIRTIKI